MALFQPDHAFCIPLIEFFASAGVENDLTFRDKNNHLFFSAGLYSAEYLDSTALAREPCGPISQAHTAHKGTAAGTVTLRCNVLFQLINPPHHQGNPARHHTR